MVPQAYKVINTHAHEISVWKILYIIIHVHDPHIGGIDGGVKSDLTTIAFNNGEQLEYFCSIII